MMQHSTKRTRLTVGLGFLLIVLVGIIGWIEFGNNSTRVNQNVDINRIVIKRTGHNDIVLARTDEDWVMTAPYALTANAQRIDPLLSLGNASFDGYDPADVDLPATGLNKPGASIVIGEREFLLGLPDADDERRYALVDGKVSFVPSWVWSLVHGGVTAFADLRVFTELPQTVFIHTDQGSRALSNPEAWLALQADKIMPWPGGVDDSVSNNSVDEASATVQWLLTSNSTKPVEPNQVIAKLLRFQNHTLINTQPNNTQPVNTPSYFAYAISNARMDALLSP